MPGDGVSEQILEVDGGAAGEEESALVTPPDEVASAAIERFSDPVFVESHGQSVLYVGTSVWRDLACWLRDEQQFTQCVDITAVDHLLNPDRMLPSGIEAHRFEVVANFLSHVRNRRIRVICQVPAESPAVPSLVEVYPGTEFPEREIFDLFGIIFDDHPDLTRILMPDDWVGSPLRKDDAPARVPVQFKGAPGSR